MIVEGLENTVSVEFTRPANTDAYTAGDVVSNSTSASTLLEFANFFRPNSDGLIRGGYIIAARLTTNKKSISPRFRVHLFNASNPTRSADNAAHQEKYADISKRLGYFDLDAMLTPADTTNSDMSRAINMYLRVPVRPASGSRSLFVLLETLDGFTPDSGQKFMLTLTGDMN